MTRKYLIIGVLVFCSIGIRAQWEPLHGPYGGRISDMGQNEEYLFVSTADGMFRSTDGRTWHPSRFVPGVHLSCGAFAVMDSIVVAAAAEMYVSFDSGDTWVQVNRPTEKSIRDVVLTGFAIYVLAVDGLWYSTDLGNTWQVSSYPGVEFPIFSMATDSQHVAIGTVGHILISSPTADTWSVVPLGFPEVNVIELQVEDSLWFAFDPQRELLLRSSNAGLQWSANVDRQWSSINIHMATLQDVRFICLDTMIVRSDDHGLTWTACGSEKYVASDKMIARDTSLFFGTFSRGVMRSDDLGEHCLPAAEGITAASVEVVVPHDQQAVAATAAPAIFEFNPTTGRWGDHYEIALPNGAFRDLFSLDGSLYLSASPGQVFRFDDAGQSWVQIANDPFANAGRMYGYNDTLLVLSDGLGLWHPDVPMWRAFNVYQDQDTLLPVAFAYDSDFLYAGHEGDVYRRTITADEWTKVFSGSAIGELSEHRIRDLYVMGAKVFLTMAVSLDNWYYRILMSEDQGLTWTFVDADFPNLTFPWWTGLGQMVEANGHVLVCGDDYSIGIVESALDDIGWRSFNEGLPNLGVQDLAVDEEYIYAALRSNGVWRRRISDLATTSIASETTAGSFRCDPNPASAYLDVTAEPHDGGDRVIYLMDMTGRLMTSKAMPDGRARIDVHHMPDGLYVLVMRNDRQVQARKIVVHH